jgi:hypothetical protein
VSVGLGGGKKELAKKNREPESAVFSMLLCFALLCFALLCFASA